jgi:hypothetical protein
MNALTNQNGDTQPQTNARSSMDSAGNHDRNLKQESQLNKKLRFRKSDKRRRAEMIAPSCPPL